MKKKVLHLKLVNSSYINGISKGFEQNGYFVTEIDYGKLLRSSGLIGTWARIFRQCEEIKPDIIFIHCNKDGFIFPAEAKELSKHGFTILYTIDVRWDNEWIEDVAPHINLVCFSDMENAELFREKGFNAEYLQVSCDTDFYKPVTPMKDYGEIVFIGNRYDNTNMDFELSDQRMEMINFMTDYFEDTFQWYGRGSKNGFLNPEQERDAYSSCKIAVTHNQFNRKGYTSDRLFRAIGCGAFTISQYYDGIENDFYGNLFSWNSLDNLKELCVNALINDTIRKGNSDVARRILFKSNTWRSRISTLKSYIKKYELIKS